MCFTSSLKKFKKGAKMWWGTLAENWQQPWCGLGRPPVQGPGRRHLPSLQASGPTAGRPWPLLVDRTSLQGPSALCSISWAETGKTQLCTVHRFQRPGCPYEFLFWAPGIDDKHNHKRIEITATSQVTPIKELWRLDLQCLLPTDGITDVSNISSVLQ